MELYVSVIGGINLDIKGRPAAALLPETSNPGDVYTSAGGVGRNIAHNLALLGTPVYLFGAVGNDAFGSRILSETKVAGVNVTYVRVLPDQPTGIYLSILNAAHDLAVAISAMDVTEAVDIAYLNEHREVLQGSRFVVADANLAAEVLNYVLELCQQAQIPCLLEPVSVDKAQKIQTLGAACDYLTPNRAELEALAQRPCRDVALQHPGRDVALQRLYEVCAALRHRCRHLLVKSGAAGVYHYDCAQQAGTWYPPMPTPVVDPNGAGDAFAAGFICGVCRGLTMATAIRFGLAAAHLTLQAKDTVNANMSFEACSGLVTGMNYKDLG